MEKEKKHLGELLISKGIITEEQLNQCLEEQKQSNKRLGEILTEKGYTDSKQIIKNLAESLNIPYIKLNEAPLDPNIIHLLSEEIVRRYSALPISKTENNIIILAMTDPLNVFAIDDIKSLIGYDIQPAICDKEELNKIVEQQFGGGADDLTDALSYVGEDELSEEIKQQEEITRLEAIAKESPIIKLVNSIIVQAIRSKVSDIHIEPDDRVLRTRYRIDGILHETMKSPKALQPAIISRIKIMSDLDIAEKRAPQDGRFQIKIDNKQIDARVSTLPTVNGEKIVIRLLDKTSVLVNLDDLGFTDNTLKDFQKLIKSPYGIIFVTGPTGSGKTTTLYAALNSINSLDKNIITVEDPVEYQLKYINQVPTNVKAGLTFATALRTMLRQDPDVVMIGEVRDAETADIAIQAALTGHLVLCTLHTNNSAGVPIRLINMGIEPFLIASSMLGAAAQRLVRTICNKCKEPYDPPELLIKELDIDLNKKPQFSRGKGCPECKNTGYKGRTGLFELLTLDDNIRELITRKSPENVIREAMNKRGVKTMRKHGIAKICDGTTTIEEILRVTQEVGG